MKFVYLLALLLLHETNAQSPSSPLMNVTQAFSQAQVVPDVISSFSPMDVVNITFTDAATMQPVNVTPGALLTMEQTAMEPEFFLISASSSAMSNQTFVLAIVDPDAPTPQNTSVSQFLHFLAADFSIDAMSDNPNLLTNSSPALMEFFPPTPPAGSDPHRYVLVVFGQPDDFDTIAPTFVNSSTPRSNFNLTIFSSSVGLGNPVAGNFFFVGPDNSTATSTAAAGSPSTMTASSPSGSTSVPAVSQISNSLSSTATTSTAAPAPMNSVSGASSKNIRLLAAIGLISLMILAIFSPFTM